MIKKTVRNQFLTGISVILPAALTIYICYFMFKILGRILLPIVMKVPILNELHYLITYIISIIALVVIVWMIGVLARNFIGKRLLKLTELIMLKAPVLNRIYEGIRQIVRTITVSKTAFQRVVMIEYPRKGIYSLAFVTNVIKDKKTKLSLFISTTPNPTSGFYLIVPEEDTVPIDMTIEEGMKLVASAGIVTPEKLAEKITRKGEN